MTDVPGDARYLTCPRCKLSIEPRSRWLGIRHCPRCLGRHRALVELFRSTVPAHVLYGDHTADRRTHAPGTPVDNLSTQRRP
jgi:Zn-finger nucleic acid-binding protein